MTEPTSKPLRVAVCGCGAPLVSTFVWDGYEFYCVECGRHFEFFGPRSAPATDELVARHAALDAEFRALAADTITPGAKLHGCDQCSAGAGSHLAHATADERKRSEVAYMALANRALKEAT